MWNKWLVVGTVFGSIAAPLSAQEADVYEPKITNLVVETRETLETRHGQEFPPAVAAALRSGALESRVRSIFDPTFGVNLLHISLFLVPGGTPMPAPSVPDESSPMLIGKFAVRVESIHIDRFPSLHGVTMLGRVVWRPNRFADPPLGSRFVVSFGVPHGETQPMRVVAGFAGVVTTAPPTVVGNVTIVLPEDRSGAQR